MDPKQISNMVMSKIDDKIINEIGLLHTGNLLGIDPTIKGAWFDFSKWRFSPNDASSLKKSWYQISVKLVKSFRNARK